jgi:hypothetical protein
VERQPFPPRRSPLFSASAAKNHELRPGIAPLRRRFQAWVQAIGEKSLLTLHIKPLRLVFNLFSEQNMLPWPGFSFEQNFILSNQ